MRDIDLMIIGGKALLLDSKNTCLDRAAVAINDGDIIAVGHSEQIAKQYRAKKNHHCPGFSDYARLRQLSHARSDDLLPRHR